MCDGSKTVSGPNEGAVCGVIYGSGVHGTNEVGLHGWCAKGISGVGQGSLSSPAISLLKQDPVTRMADNATRSDGYEMVDGTRVGWLAYIAMIG